MLNYVKGHQHFIFFYKFLTTLSQQTTDKKIRTLYRDGIEIGTHCEAHSATKTTYLAELEPILADHNLEWSPVITGHIKRQPITLMVKLQCGNGTHDASIEVMQVHHYAFSDDFGNLK